MLKKGLMLLILLVTTSSLSFSQTDTTQVSLPVTIVRLTIKDLIRGDGYREEVKLLNEKIILFENQENTYLSIISTRETQIENFKKIIYLKEEQILEYDKALKQTNRELYLANLKLKIYNRVGILILGGLLISAL
jgi:hypothetical protein